MLYLPFDASAAERWYSEAQAENGKAVFNAHCAICHGPEAAGTTDWRKPLTDGRYPPPPLNGTAHAWHHPLSSLRRQIRQGGAKYGGWMPALGTSLTDEQIDDAIAFFQSLWTDKIYAEWKQIDNSESKALTDRDHETVQEQSTNQSADVKIADSISRTDLLRHLSKRLPESKLGDPQETPLKGIYRILLDDKTIYISSDGRYVFLGDMVDLVSGRNISKQGVP